MICEQGSTDDLVNTVAQVDYSIGYADVPNVRQTSGVTPVGLDDRAATLDGILDGYPFWTVEYLYGHGPLVPGTLAASFADYLAGPESSGVMADFEYTACLNGPARLCESRR